MLTAQNNIAFNQLQASNNFTELLKKSNRPKRVKTKLSRFHEALDWDVLKTKPPPFFILCLFPYIPGMAE